MARSPEPWIAQAYDACAPELYRYALMILADHALAQDALQQAFMRLISRDNATDIRTLKPFLRIIVRNESYRLLAQRRSIAETTDLVSVVEPAAPPTSLPLEQQEESQHLNRALRKLPAEQREIIHLKFYDQLTFAQIAEVLAIPANTAASRYRLALERLRALMSRGEPHE